LFKQNIDIYDKNNCLDTFRTEIILALDLKFDRTTKWKYDNQKRISVKITNRKTTNFFYDEVTGTFIEPGNSIIKDSFVYTPSNIRYDTIMNYKYDTVGKKWVFNRFQFLRKHNFGFDTVKFKDANDYTYTVIYDNKGREIKYCRYDANKTKDSILHFYDNADREILYEYFSTDGLHPSLYLTSMSKKIYEGDKLIKLTSFSLDGTEHDTVRYVTNYTYGNNNNLELEEQYREVKPNGGTSKFYDKQRTRYTKFNAFNKCTEKEIDYYSDWLTKWVFETRSKMKYYKDTLLLSDSIIGYTNNRINGYDKIRTFEYYDCNSTTSSIESINQGIDFSLSPNPTTGTFNLTLSDKAVQAGAIVRVYNIQGSEVYYSKITSTSTAVDISNLSKGFYLVKVADKTHFTVKKLVLN
jgi:Secretion system C-terminal sorting domain